MLVYSIGQVHFVRGILEACIGQVYLVRGMLTDCIETGLFTSNTRNLYRAGSLVMWYFISLYRASSYVKWNDRSLFGEGWFSAAARKLDRYKLELMVVQEVMWDTKGTVRAGFYNFVHGNRNKFPQIWTGLFVHHIIISALNIRDLLGIGCRIWFWQVDGFIGL